MSLLAVIGGFGLGGRTSGEPAPPPGAAAVAPPTIGESATPRMREALAALADAEARLASADGPIERLGLVRGGVDEARARAVAARRHGDPPAVEDAADELRRYAAGATGNGLQRLAWVSGVVMLAGFLGFLLRRRSHWEPDEPARDGDDGLEVHVADTDTDVHRPAVDLVAAGAAGTAALVSAGR